MGEKKREFAIDEARELVANRLLWPRVRDFLWDFAPQVHESWLEDIRGRETMDAGREAVPSQVSRLASSPRVKRFILDQLGVEPCFHDFPKDDGSRLVLLDGATPILTMWFEVANGLADGAKIEFAFTEPIKSDSVSAGSYHSEKRTVGADLHPYIVTAETLYGDANCDGSVTAADAALILRALTGLDTLSDQGMKNAKVDGTDTLNTEDAAMILRFVVRLIARFPVQD